MVSKIVTIEKIDNYELDQIKFLYKVTQHGHFCHGLTHCWSIKGLENLEKIDKLDIIKYQNKDKYNIPFYIKLYKQLFNMSYFNTSEQLIKYVVSIFNKKLKLHIGLIDKFSYKLSNWHEVGLYKNQYFDANIGLFEFKDLYTCMAWLFISRNLKYKYVLIVK